LKGYVYANSPDFERIETETQTSSPVMQVSCEKAEDQGAFRELCERIYESGKMLVARADVLTTLVDSRQLWWRAEQDGARGYGLCGTSWMSLDKLSSFVD
jgi:hypothetical protein